MGLRQVASPVRPSVGLAAVVGCLGTVSKPRQPMGWDPWKLRFFPVSSTRGPVRVSIGSSGRSWVDGGGTVL